MKVLLANDGSKIAKDALECKSIQSSRLFSFKWYKQIHDLFHTGYLQNLHTDDNRLYIVHVVDSRYGFENKGELKFFSINKLHKYFSNDKLTSSSNVFKSM